MKSPLNLNRARCYKVHYIAGSIGPREICRGLHKARTPRRNGTNSTFKAYSTNGQLKPWLMLAEGFWAGFIQAAAYLGRESVRINVLKRCPRLAEAVNDFCACCVLNYTQTFMAEKHTAAAGKWVLFTITPFKTGKMATTTERD